MASVETMEATGRPARRPPSVPTPHGARLSSAGKKRQRRRRRPATAPPVVAAAHRRERPRTGDVEDPPSADAVTADTGAVAPSAVGTSTITSFSQMMLQPAVLLALTDAGYLRPSPVQRQVIPLGKLGVGTATQKPAALRERGRGSDEAGLNCWSLPDRRHCRPGQVGHGQNGRVCRLSIGAAASGAERPTGTAGPRATGGGCAWLLT